MCHLCDGKSLTPEQFAEIAKDTFDFMVGRMAGFEAEPSLENCMKTIVMMMNGFLVEVENKAPEAMGAAIVDTFQLVARMLTMSFPQHFKSFEIGGNYGNSHPHKHSGS